MLLVFLSNYKIVFLSSRNFVQWQGNITFQEPLITKKQKSDKFWKQKHRNRGSSHALANSQLRKSFWSLRLVGKFKYFRIFPNILSSLVYWHFIQTWGMLWIWPGDNNIIFTNIQRIFRIFKTWEFSPRQCFACFKSCWNLFSSMQI